MFKQLMLAAVVALLVGCATVPLTPATPTQAQFDAMKERVIAFREASCAGEPLIAVAYAFENNLQDIEWTIYTSVNTRRLLIVIRWESGPEGKPDAIWEDRNNDGTFERISQGREDAGRHMAELTAWCMTGRRTS